MSIKGLSPESAQFLALCRQADTLGLAPSGFNYGSEYTTEAQMLAAFSDDSTYTHGSHVTGIAAGCGAPSGNGTAYQGQVVRLAVRHHNIVGMAADGAYQMPSSGVYILHVNGFKPRKVVVVG